MKSQVSLISELFHKRDKGDLPVYIEMVTDTYYIEFDFELRQGDVAKVLEIVDTGEFLELKLDASEFSAEPKPLDLYLDYDSVDVKLHQANQVQQLYIKAIEGMEDPVSYITYLEQLIITWEQLGIVRL